MLVTDLFGSNRFIVLERESLNDVLAEQEFCIGQGWWTLRAIPPKQLEGAELIVLGALTALDAGKEGGAIPDPVPVGEATSRFSTSHQARLCCNGPARDRRATAAWCRPSRSKARTPKLGHASLRLLGGGGYIHLPLCSTTSRTLRSRRRCKKW